MKHSTMMKAAVLAVLVATLPAAAAITQVANLGALGANDTVSIGSMGPSGTFLWVPTTAPTAAGSTTTFNAASSLYRMDQGVNWSGNFATGTSLLYSAGNTSITINPSQLVKGAGLQIQANYIGSYSAQVDAFDASGNLLGSVSGSGVSNTNADGSALFLGFLSNTFDVDKLVVRLLSPSTKLGKFAIGNVNLVESSGTVGMAIPPSPVPESKSAGLLGGLTLLLAGAWQRARRQNG